MPDTTITRIGGRRVWDSRGRPTVEAEIHLAGGASGRAIAPAGASRGSREAIELRDADGLGVKAAVGNVNGAIAAALAGMDASRQEDIDAKLIGLDGTPNKARLAPTPRSPCPWLRCTRRRARTACLCSATLPRAGRYACRCPKSRFSAAARTPAGASTSRT